MFNVNLWFEMYKTTYEIKKDCYFLSYCFTYFWLLLFKCILIFKPFEYL